MDELKNRLGKRFIVPRRPGDIDLAITKKWIKTPDNDPQIFKAGQTVTWRVDRKRADGPDPFRAVGKIVDIYETTFGGKVTKLGAKIQTRGKYLEIYPGRKYTIVAVDKLRLFVSS